MATLNGGPRAALRPRLLALVRGQLSAVKHHLSFPELLPEYVPHNVREVYLIQWEQPHLVVDITDTMELKLEAIRCHASQVGDFKAMEARMRNRAATIGQDKGNSYAEEFDHIIVPG